MKIVTLTLNPAFDVHCFAESFKPYHESIADILSVEAGGKGVNISRALRVNGTDNLTVVVVGQENGGEFCRALEADGLTCAAVWTQGRIRENITIHEASNPETRISFNGFSCNAAVLAQVKECVGAVDESTIVTFTGSIPKGIGGAEVLRFLGELRDGGARIVIDSRSVALDDLVAFRPWLIKPNKDEAEGYTGQRIESVNDAVRMAKALHKEGVENVIISLGGDGAVLACARGVFYAKAPNVKVESTIGAGDSMIAGFIDGVARGFSAEDALKQATAYGTAACLQQGTRPPCKTDVERLLPDVRVQVLA